MSTKKTTTMAPPKSRLTCELCQRRKVKCDKGNPCSTCQRAGVKCEAIDRQRLPRGRNGGRRKGDTDLKARVARLESLLVSNLGGTLKLDDSLQSSNDETVKNESIRTHQGDMSRYLGSSFWSSLSSEVNGLRDVLDNSSDSESGTPESVQTPETPSSTNPSAFNFVLCGPGSFMMAPNALKHPPKPMAELLSVIYFQNVDPLFKILHGPSVRNSMHGARPDLGQSSGDASNEALNFAIYYAAINTQDELVCKQKFGEEKTTLLSQFRFAIEVSLAKADLVNTTDIETLQAFVIFLAAVRLNDNSRWSWTLLGLAVRIAHALGLHTDDSYSRLKPFQAEMRRRLWQQIGILDLNAAMDRGSDPIIAATNSTTPLPVNINDSDMSPDSRTPYRAREGFTDMTFGLMCQESTSLIRRLNYVPRGEAARQPSEIEGSWDRRKEMVHEYRKLIQEKYLRHFNMAIPFQWFARGVADCMISGMLLHAVRPMQRHPKSQPPQEESSKVLNLAIEVLTGSHEMLCNPVTEPWRWFVWVQWHALAVALAELCSQTEGPLVDRAWEVVNITFQEQAFEVADSRKGMLWQPIEKLMRRAQQNRAKAQAAKQKVNAEQWGAAIQTKNPPSQIAPYQVAALSTELKAIAPTPGTNYNSVGDGPIMNWNTESLPSIDNDPFGMAWVNWENFVEDVNVTDFDMSEPWRALQP